MSALDIQENVPPLSTCILIDGNELGELPVYNRLFIPFLERGGQYWGNPAESNQAIQELERLRSERATFLVIAWTARWWFDTYPEFVEYMRTRYPLSA